MQPPLPRSNNKGGARLEPPHLALGNRIILLLRQNFLRPRRAIPDVRRGTKLARLRDVPGRDGDCSASPQKVTAAQVSLRKVSRRPSGQGTTFLKYSNKSERGRATSGNFRAGEIDRVFSWETCAAVRTYEQGAALLATTLAVMLILIAVGASMVSSGLFEGFLSDTQADALEAYVAAESGVSDARLRNARDKTFTSAGYFIPLGCTLNGATACTKVVVETSQSVCSQSIGANEACVISIGTTESRTRTIEVILSVDPDNGKIMQVSWKEL